MIFTARLRIMRAVYDPIVQMGDDSFSVKNLTGASRLTPQFPPQPDAICAAAESHSGTSEST